MSYLALARKWRPKAFADVIGQAHVVSALSNALNNQRVHHAFLFTGTRGVGKTTLARIFAKALNCENGVSAGPCGQCIACQGVDNGNFIDLIEVDAASRTKVDDTRELLDNVQYTPTQGRYKIYLIDEVHMLSTHSFNALLKTLEEPPEHVKFLLATTNPQKLPTTILSRCIQFNLKSVDLVKLTSQLEKILKAEDIEFEASALMLLARSANGSVRDALSLLDQAIAFSNGNVNTDQVRSMLGMIDDQLINQLLTQVLQGDGTAVLQSIAQMAERSAEFSSALDELLALIHNVALYQISPESVSWKGVDSSSLKALADNVDADALQLLYQIAIIGKRDLDYAADPRSGFEMILIRMLAFIPEGKQGSVNLPSLQTPLPTAETTPAEVSKSTNKAKATVAIVENSVQENTDDASPANPLIIETISDKPVSNEAVTEADLAPTNTITSIEQLNDLTAWNTFIENSGLNGMSKQILMNMVPQSVNGSTVNLLLDASSRSLFSEDRLKKIEKHCQQQLAIDISFNVEVAEIDKVAPGKMSPTQQRQRAIEEKQQNAKLGFETDHNVQKLVETFDAQVVTESILPGNQ